MAIASMESPKSPETMDAAEQEPDERAGELGRQHGPARGRLLAGDLVGADLDQAPARHLGREAVSVADCRRRRC